MELGDHYTPTQLWVAKKLSLANMWGMDLTSSVYELLTMTRRNFWPASQLGWLCGYGYMYHDTGRFEINFFLMPAGGAQKATFSAWSLHWTYLTYYALRILVHLFHFLYATAKLRRNLFRLTYYALSFLDSQTWSRSWLGPASCTLADLLMA